MSTTTFQATYFLSCIRIEIVGCLQAEGIHYAALPSVSDSACSDDFEIQSCLAISNSNRLSFPHLAGRSTILLTWLQTYRLSFPHLAGRSTDIEIIGPALGLTRSLLDSSTTSLGRHVINSPGSYSLMPYTFSRP